MTDQQVAPPSIIPPIRPLAPGSIMALLVAGWADFRRAPAFGLFFSLVYVLGGWMLWVAFTTSGNMLWFFPVAVGFPILAPFAAAGLYEVSRRLERGEPLDWRGVLGCVFAQRDRQTPSMAAMIVLVFLFWLFVAHVIFALFFGIGAITSSMLEMLFSGRGLSMLALGTAIGGAMAAAFFSLTVISLPLLLDKEVDFITAMITSWQSVAAAPVQMFTWAAVIAVLLFVAMLPGFLGLFIVLPVLGHASWHLYRQVLPDNQG